MEVPREIIIEEEVIVPVEKIVEREVEQIVEVPVERLIEIPKYIENIIEREVPYEKVKNIFKRKKDSRSSSGENSRKTSLRRTGCRKAYLYREDRGGSSGGFSRERNRGSS